MKDAQMTVPLELTGLTKVFPTPAGPFIAVKDVNVTIGPGEFVAILGHSGCGKSTVLSIVGGLERATYGGVVIDGKEVRGPGPERAIVFQSPCLLPWLTSRQNVRLAAAQAHPRAGAGTAADRYLALVGVPEVAYQRPAQLSLGTQQCVSLARALSMEPRFLLLDEPFSMLDSLTRFELQETLLRVWEDSGKTVILVTHDIDEALYLSDRLVLMTDGPEATVGDVLHVPFPRPRTRAGVLGHAAYHACRRRVIDFLEHHAHQSRPSALDVVLGARRGGGVSDAEFAATTRRDPLVTCRSERAPRSGGS
jgi:nitrate/nitrite transport system ATP-binding protein